MDLFGWAYLKNLDILLNDIDNLQIVSSIDYCDWEMSIITSANKLAKQMKGMAMINPATT